MSGSLAHPVEQIIQYLLDDLDLCTLPSENGAWPVYCSNLPDTPDNCIAVIKTPGIIDARLQTGGEVIEHYGIQVFVRSVTLAVGDTKARAICIALAESVKRTQVIIASNTYTVNNISRASGPIPLGKESPESKRELFSINFTVSLRQTI